MKLPELRKKIRTLFTNLRAHRGDAAPGDDASLEISAGELAAFITDLMKNNPIFLVDDDTPQRQIAKALADLLDLIERGELVRNVRQDHGEGWAARMLAFVLVLKHATEATETAREKGWIG